jgi:methyl-accepting chemotaxis protein
MEQSIIEINSYTLVNEVKTLSEQLIEHSQQVSEAALRTASVAETGLKAGERAIEGTVENQSKVHFIKESIETLSKKSGQINEILFTINDMAMQSNMLALNTAIEAALAGDAGQGFAVIAQEMRALAESSRAATVQVKRILAEIQTASKKSVAMIDDLTSSMDIMVERTEEAHTTIEELSKAINASAQMAQEITAQGKQQLALVDEMTSALQSN